MKVERKSLLFCYLKIVVVDTKNSTDVIGITATMS